MYELGQWLSLYRGPKHEISMFCSAPPHLPTLQLFLVLMQMINIDGGCYYALTWGWGGSSLEIVDEIYYVLSTGIINYLGLISYEEFKRKIHYNLEG